MSASPRPSGAVNGEMAGHQEGGEVGVVVVAAGEARRMAGIDKIFAPILAMPLIAHTIEAFEACSIVREVVLVVSAGQGINGPGPRRRTGMAKGEGGPSLPGRTPAPGLGADRARAPDAVPLGGGPRRGAALLGRWASGERPGSGQGHGSSGSGSARQGHHQDRNPHRRG